MDLSARQASSRLYKVFIYTVLFVLIFALTILFFITRNGLSFILVDGNSMSPSLKDRDNIIISQEKTIEQNHIIVFDHPVLWDYSGPSTGVLIKRVAAVPGDTLAFDGETFTVNGIKFFNVKENDYECSNGDENYSHVLSHDEIFVTGDNFNESLDSRRIFCDGAPGYYVPQHEIIAFGNIIAKY